MILQICHIQIYLGFNVSYTSAINYLIIIVVFKIRPVGLQLQQYSINIWKYTDNGYLLCLLIPSGNNSHKSLK